MTLPHLDQEGCAESGEVWFPHPTFGPWLRTLQLELLKVRFSRFARGPKASAVGGVCSEAAVSRQEQRLPTCRELLCRRRRYRIFSAVNVNHV